MIRFLKLQKYASLLSGFETEHHVFKRFWEYNVRKKYGKQFLR